MTGEELIEMIQRVDSSGAPEDFYNIITKRPFLS